MISQSSYATFWENSYDEIDKKLAHEDDAVRYLDLGEAVKDGLRKMRRMVDATNVKNPVIAVFSFHYSDYAICAMCPCRLYIEDLLNVEKFGRLEYL